MVDVPSKFHFRSRKEQYESIIENTSEFRKLVDSYIEQFTELFPQDIQYGYKLHRKLWGAFPPSHRIR